MNYRHSYHAGSFSDVFKHIVLISLIEALKQKPKPFCIIETHAGAGLYDLTDVKEAGKTEEYKSGILRLSSLVFARDDGSEIIHDDSIPNYILDYLKVVKQYQFPHYYPGSPLLTQAFLRKDIQDKMILMELHPKEAYALRTLFRKDKKVSVHHQDGYLGLKAFLPPKERRGLVFIDPPFENKNEWEQMLESLRVSLQRFSNGIYAIWYPIKDRKIVSSFIDQLKQEYDKDKILNCEFSIYPEDSPMGLTASGVVVINHPYQWDVQLKPLMGWLWKILSPLGHGYYRLS